MLLGGIGLNTLFHDGALSFRVTSVGYKIEEAGG